MIRFVLAILAILAISSFTIAPASAARLPLDALVRVLDLPDTPSFQRDDGTYVDLGYKHTVFGEGAWIGYLDHDSYLELTSDQARMLVAMAGLSQLPDVPDVPLQIRIVQGLGLLGIAGFLLSLFRRGSGGRKPDRSVAMERYAEMLEAEGPAPQQEAPAPRPEPQPAALRQGVPRKAFGHR